MSRGGGEWAALVAAMQEYTPTCQGDGCFILDDQPANTLRYVCARYPLCGPQRTIRVVVRGAEGLH